MPGIGDTLESSVYRLCYSCEVCIVEIVAEEVITDRVGIEAALCRIDNTLLIGERISYCRFNLRNCPVLVCSSCLVVVCTALKERYDRFGAQSDEGKLTLSVDVTECAVYLADSSNACRPVRLISTASLFVITISSSGNRCSGAVSTPT